MRVLFVTCNGIEDAAFGGAKASIRNYELLKKSAEVEVYHIRKKSGWKSLLSALQGYFPPADRGSRRDILQKLKDGKQWDAVFFDSSHFGKIVEAVRKSGAKTILFFQNCEYDYIEVRFGAGNSLKKLIYKRLIKRQEKLAAQLADRTIAFTNRDAKRVEELYGVKITDVIPLSIKDVFVKREPNSEEKICLLFGPLGQANEEGFGWFVKNVSPKLHCRTVVAGRGFESYRDKWSSDKVEVVGTVGDIAALYASASCVAIPLLSGGGMKIKTAEALMFGKYIFGTDEAFVGYDFAGDRAGVVDSHPDVLQAAASGRRTDVPQAAAVCNTAEEFVEQINHFLESGRGAYNEISRRIYEENYSLQASEKDFARVLEELG